MIRIVSGDLRGRRLAVGPGVRPTTERAREALFSILGERVRGARVLDAAAAGDLETVVGGTFGFGDVAAVHEDLAARRTIGKILLDPSL